MKDKKIIAIDTYGDPQDRIPRLAIVRRLRGKAFDSKHLGICRLIGEEREFVLRDKSGFALIRENGFTVWVSEYAIYLN